MNVLVAGGAGFIGSHVVRLLRREGHACVVYDNLSKGHRAAAGEATVVEGDVAETPKLTDTMKRHEVDLVIHFAAYIEAGESMQVPEKYYRNNTLAGLSMLEAMRDAGVGRMVFSSTAAVYGTPERIPIKETDRLAPINPYGASKLCTEYMMRGFAEAHGLGFAALRYFNVAGAHPDGDIGEDHSPETHLIPLVLQVALGQRDEIKIFGDDYDTSDGSCVRDYIHVCDLADAHLLAAEAIEPGVVKAYNLGNGEGFSVKQVIETCRSVTGMDIPATVAARRPGDPARLVAASDKAMAELGWRPKYPQLSEIVQHAWAWHRAHPTGYAD
jgi:UDP-glucose 4-epimerase